MVCAAEFEHRGKEWLSIARRAFANSSTRWTDANTDALRELLHAELQADWDSLLDLYRESVRPHNGSKRFGALNEALGRVEAELAHELQLLVLGEDRSRVPVTDRLTAPRYTDVLAAWHSATTNPRATDDQRVQAIRDAVGAVEQLARIVTDSPTATLGQSLAALKRADRVEAPLLRGIEELWGWTSNAAGLRHGASASEQPSGAESEYCLKLAEASLILLLSLDHD